MGRKKVTLEQKISMKTLLGEKLSHTEISKRLGVSRKCVYNVEKKVLNNDPLVNKPGQGRLKCTTRAEDRHLIQMCKRNRTKSSRQLSSEWSSAIGKLVSASTTRRRLFSYGLKSYTQKRRPYRNRQQIKKKVRLV